ncbi:tetratricopeptide repeat protein [Streptomyces sp. RPA4-2]|uniref:ATP-binding protein n=1 Tax=Streptomyces sp. RPA4-2 TaxID=2721244 RepID=UPI00143EE5CF|nr:tetratricopeptide repeat protein [Streptomyces sp. RPA4-2]QIY63457.1 tetratricopeptide repeat protein [Streptomyces sp. RPA4-2]
MAAHYLTARDVYIGDRPLAESSAQAVELPPLPEVAPGFTGRTGELEDLLAVLSSREGAGEEEPGAATSVVVSAAVRGMGGIGKTTLALSAGWRALEAGAFTGALFLDLRGYDDVPVDAARALDDVLRQLGVDAAQIPPELAQRAAVYRAQLGARARRGERLLVIADNASAGEQVEWLIPSGPHRLLITSRDDLSHIGAQLVDLDTLLLGEAIDLLDAAVRTALPKDGRVAADTDGARRVAELCGCLPLALRIAAAQMVADRSLKPADLAADLEDPAGRLDVLDDGSRAVRGVVQRSVRRLSLPQAELFWLLTVNPGPDFSLDTAVAISGVGKAKDVRLRLAALGKASLLRQDPVSGRWSMHDLVRAYANEQAARYTTATGHAFRRLLEHYTRFAANAAVHVDRSARGEFSKVDSSRFRDRFHAMAWFEAERANLVAAIQAAYVGGHFRIAARLPSLLTRYLHMRRLLNDALTVDSISLGATRALSDRTSQARAWMNLSNTLGELRRFEEALSANRRALEGFGDLGDAHGQASAWMNLAGTLGELRRFEEALGAHQRAVDGFGDLGDAHGQATARMNLGTTLAGVRRFEEALGAHQRAVDGFGDLGDAHALATARMNLGTTLAGVRRFEEALGASQRALEGFGDLGDAHGQATAWMNIGYIHGERGCFEEALGASQRALEGFGDLGDAHGQATAWMNIGYMLGELRRFEEALGASQRALEGLGDLGDAHGQATAWTNLGMALRGRGEFGLAEEAGKRSAALFEELGDSFRRGKALSELALTLSQADRGDGEVQAMRETAAELLRAVGANDEAERVLRGIKV